MPQEPGESSPPARRKAPASDRDRLLSAMDTAVAQQRSGQLDAAIEGYRQVLRLDPDFVQAHNNLGVALKATGQTEEAVASYRRALALAPTYAVAHSNLSAALAELGRHAESAHHALKALRLEPGNAEARRRFAQALRAVRLKKPNGAIAKALLVCLADPGIEHQVLVPAALSLLLQDPDLNHLLELAAGDDDAAILTGLRLAAARALFDNPLLRALMTQTIVASAGFERLFTTLRRLCLTAVNPDGPGEIVTMIDEQPDFFVALACQCALTDYAAEESPEETERLSNLIDKGPAHALASGRVNPELLVLALYRPLAGLREAEALHQALGNLVPPYGLLITRQLREPLAEQKAAAEISQLTKIEHPVSLAVGRQYEEHPYPRWRSTWHKQPQPLARVVRDLFPRAPDIQASPKPTQVLVAGCGTGKHAIDVALRYADAEVLALDLSRRALGYALRQARARNLNSVTFAQADLLALDDLNRRFHLIECLGVLHHLADPLEGWRKLTALLEPGGYFRIGLYSRRERAGILAARDFLRDQGFQPNQAGIRTARAAIRALPDDHAAHPVVEELDFYSLTGCRDLLFNVQETDFALEEIGRAIDELGLEFLGFEFFDSTPKLTYAQRYPDDPAMIDLANWASLEKEQPGLFSRMYQFWCRLG